MAALRRRVVQKLPESSRVRLRQARRAMRVLQWRAARTTKLSVPVVGIVERVAETQISGWVMVPIDMPPDPVDLSLGSIKLSSTYPTPKGALAGM